MIPGKLRHSFYLGEVIIFWIKVPHIFNSICCPWQPATNWTRSRIVHWVPLSLTLTFFGLCDCDCIFVGQVLYLLTTLAADRDWSTSRMDPSPPLQRLPLQKMPLPKNPLAKIKLQKFPLQEILCKNTLAKNLLAKIARNQNPHAKISLAKKPTC